MSTRVLQWPIKVPIGEIGGSPVMPSYDFLRYLETQRERSGGNEALTNIELEELSDTRFETLTYLSLAPANPRQTRFDAAGFLWRFRSVSASTSVAVGEFVDVDASAAAVTVTLPSVSASKGRIVGVSKVDTSANLVTVSGTINGQSSVSITRQYTALVFMSNGSEWRII